MGDMKKHIKDKGYTLQSFAEEVLGVKRLALYRKIKGEVKFTKLEKEKIKEVLGIDLDKDSQEQFEKFVENFSNNFLNKMYLSDTNVI